MSSQILVYSGPGADSFCSKALETQVKDLCDDRIYRISSFTSFSNWSDPRSIKAIFVPGGNTATLLFYSDLKEKAVQSIFINLLDQHRISYYGTCSGGILASSALCSRSLPPFHENGFSLKERPCLGLFPGKTISPLFTKPYFGDEKLVEEDFKMPNIRFIQDSGNLFLNSSLIFGTGYLNAQTVANTEIVSTYTDILTVKLGNIKERVFHETHSFGSEEIAESICHRRQSGASIFLTGSHLEIDSIAVRSEIFKDIITMTNEKQQQLADSMQSGDESRKILLKENFKKIGLTCK